MPIRPIWKQMANTSPTKQIALALTVCMLMGQSVFAAPQVLSGDVRITVTPTEIDKLVPITGGAKQVNMSLHGVSLHDAFRALAKQAGFSVLVDESVEGTINVNLKNVTVQDALETLKTYGNLAYSVQSNQLIVAKADSDKAKGFQRSHSKIIPLQFANAKVIANMLNMVLYGGPGSQGGVNQNAPTKVSYDYQTNSLIVVGTPNDIETVEEHVKALDAPRETRTWRLSHANALQVASILSSSLFNEGIPSITIGTAGGSSSSMPGSSIMPPASLKVHQEKIEESTGVSTVDATSTGSTGVTASNGSAKIRALVKEDQIAQVSPNGPVILPDTRLNTITLMGTAEQIAMAEALIPTLDRKVPQVVLEVSLIEISDRLRKELSHNMGGTANQFLMGSNNTTGSTPFSNTAGITTDLRQVVLGYATNPIRKLREDFKYQLTALARDEKLKILANPTVSVASDSEAVVSIVDEIIRRNELTINSVGNLVASEAELGEVGVILNLLPKVGANGTVSLRIRPTVSTLSNPRTDAFGGQVNLVSKRELLIQNAVLHDGESFVLGGLVNKSDTDVAGKIPILGDLPIVSALARSSALNGRNSELIIIITPHVMNDESDMARAPNSPMQPVNLQSEPGSKLESQTFIPVSNTGLNKTTSDKLPPLEPARPLDTSLLDTPKLKTRKIIPSARSDQRPQAMMMMQDELQPIDNLESEVPSANRTLQPTDRGKSISGGAVSDEQVRTIIRRFVK